MGRLGVKLTLKLVGVILLLIIHLEHRHTEVEGASSVLWMPGSIRTSESLISSSGVFEFGFYPAPGSSSHRFGLAIWYAQLPNSVRTIVWMAGRNAATLSRSAYVTLSEPGGILQLLDPAVSPQLPVWQSVNNGDATNLELRDSGNLVLVNNGTNTVVWQSFDTPTDTLLPDQVFSVNMSIALASWKQQTTDWSEGYYEASFVNQSFSLSWTGTSIANWNRSSWSTTNVTQGNGNTIYPYQQDTSSASYVVLDSASGSFFLGASAAITNTSTGGLRRVTLDEDGGLRMYSWGAGAVSWNEEGNWMNDSCRIFAECGPFGVCSSDPFSPATSASCTCPDEFIPVDQTNELQGCKPVHDLLVNHCSVNSSLFQMIKVGDYDYPYADRMYPGVNIDEASCVQRCLDECGCAGAVYWRRGNTCFIKSSPLFNGGFPQEVGNRTAYLKVLKASPPAASRTHVVGLVAGLLSAAVAITLGFILLALYRRRRVTSPSFNYHLLGGPRTFTFKELSLATKNFAESEQVGSGGMGCVYKGTLRPSGAVVAVKRIRHESASEGEEGFLAEVSTISQIRHRNLLQLQGWCHEDGKLLLVYDYMPNGSLDQWLHSYGTKTKSKSLSTTAGKGKLCMRSGREGLQLSWELRYGILKGVAAALAYLHEEWQQCVLHRDIKSSNVMLDAEFDAHLGDFGLARLIDHQKLDKTTLMAGTLGYMAPEMPYTGKATKESDVYSFGVLMLEVVSGRPPVQSTGDIEPENVVLLNRVWRAHEAGQLLSMVDPVLDNNYAHKLHAFSRQGLSETEQGVEVDYSVALSRRIQQEIVNENEQKVMVLEMGLLCCLPNPLLRPKMTLINQTFLSGDSTALPPLPPTAYFGSQDVLSAVRSGFHPQPLVSEQSISPIAHSNSSDKGSTATPTGTSDVDPSS